MFGEKKKPATKLDTAGMEDLKDLLDDLIAEEPTDKVRDLVPLRGLLYNTDVSARARVAMVKAGLKVICQEHEDTAWNDLAILRSRLRVEEQAAAVTREAMIRKQKIEAESVPGRFWMKGW